MATTGEYSNYFGATSAAQSDLVLSQVVTAVNRVNEVYEADFTVRLLLIANTTSVFYYNPNTDPYTNNNGSIMLSQNQTTLDNVIGTANYDIGHVFSTGGGGVAHTGALCSSMNKARGVTGLTNPVGDPFYIDYVAHEMGHQFSAHHTFNGTTGNCSGSNRTATSAYEPGSGSTIMAYAGICGVQNLQPNSDAYMHARSLLQITDRLSATSCADFLTFNNSPPVVSNIPNYTIPVSTPFVLTASATDPDGDPLTYCWEQYDLENPADEPPASDDTNGPLFRSFLPSPSPSRYFPRLQDIVQNINPVWEVLPSVSRTMTFRMTARDYHGLAGCTNHDDVVVTTTSSAGPFVVTSHNAGATWLETSQQTITWNVANTTASPVNCALVDIRLSYDGGLTYPALLAQGIPNNGSAMVTIPAGVTTTGRIMVKASNNIFFDINNSHITINPGIPNFTLAVNPSAATACNDGTIETVIEVGQILGFADPVTLGISGGLPPGAFAIINPGTVLPGSTATLTLINLTALSGMYTVTVQGSSTPGTKTAPFEITVTTPLISGPLLTSPADDATGIVLSPLLQWQAFAGSTGYAVEIAEDAGFSNLVASGSTTNTQYQVTAVLSEATQYYWRVRATNDCGTGPWSAVSSFTTFTCFAFMSQDVPKTIPESGTPTVLSVLNCPLNMTVADINVIQLTGLHTWISDLRFTLIAPDASQRIIWNQPCTNQDNFNINFDDAAANSSWPCPPTDGLTYKPSNTLSFFNGKEASGIWTLRVQDLANQDGGSLQTWGIKVCGAPGCQLAVSQTSGSGAGSLPAAIQCAGPGDTIRLAAALSGQVINIGPTPLVLNEDIVIMAEGTNITITGTGTRVFELTLQAQVEFSGFTIIAGNHTQGGAIFNQGILGLHDILLEPHAGVPDATLLHNAAGALVTVHGECLLGQ